MREASWRFPFLPVRNVNWCVLALILAMLPSLSRAQGTCVAGSGTCSDGFSGTSGTVLTAYNSSWVKMKGTADAYTSGSGTAAIAGSNYAYYSYSGSSSETSQILVKASGTVSPYTREACVRMVAGVGGYCVGFGGVSGGNYYGCYLEVGGSYLSNGQCGVLSATIDHALAIVASGTSPVSLDVYVDGVRTTTVTDNSHALTAPSSGFALIGNGNPADAQAGQWQDYQGSALLTQADLATPSFSCPAGSGTCYDAFTGSSGKPLTQYNRELEQSKRDDGCVPNGSKGH